jgi:hypothetical protein
MPRSNPLTYENSPFNKWAVFLIVLMDINGFLGISKFPGLVERRNYFPGVVHDHRPN